MRKATISFVLSARPSLPPSVRMEQLHSHGTYIHENLILETFSKISGENSILTKIL